MQAPPNDAFAVSQDCVRVGLRAGAVVFHDVRISDAAPDLQSEIAEEIERVRRQYASLEQVLSTPHLVTLHTIFRGIGVNPRKHLSSVHSLFRSAIKHGALPAINNFVDAYNLMSLRSKCSLGAHDLDRIALPVTLRFLRGDESFIPLGSNEVKKVKAGEFGYVDAQDRLLCRLDVVQADFSKLTAETKNVLLINEGTTAHAPDELKKIFDETIALLQGRCGGTAEVVAFPYSR